MELSVEITGNIDKLGKALDSADGKLNKFGKNAEKIESRFVQSNMRATKSTDKLNKSVGNGSVALTSFSRVIQDAPYGLNAVGNNITNLTEQFGYLMQRTGGAKGALKSMLSSLKGFGGISLAISVVTSLMVVFSDKIFGASKAQDKLKDSAKGATGELENQKKTVTELIAKYDRFKQAKELARFSTIKEREEVKALTRNVLDYTNSEEERSRALESLTEKYAKYFKGLKVEDTNKIIKAEIATTRILELKEKKIRALNDLERVGRDIQIKQLKLDKIHNEGKKTGIKLLGTEILKLKEQQKVLRDALELYSSIDLNLTASDAQRPVVEGIKTQMKGISDAWIAEAAATSQNLSQYNPFPEVDLQPIQNSLSNYELLMLEFNERIKEGVGQSIVNTFQLLGNNIGQALSNGGNIFKAVGSTILQGMGQFLSRMGDLLIKYGLLAKMKGKLDLAIAKGGPFAIGAGVAAVALGVALKAIGSAFSNASQGGFSGGNVGSGTGNFNSGSSIGSSIFSSNNLANQNLTFTIQGTDLVAVLNSTTNQNGIFGGNVFVSN